MPPPIAFRLDGQPAPRAMLDDLVEFSVTRSLHLPGALMLRLANRDLRWLEGATLLEGRQVEVFAGDGEGESLFSGRITVLEPELSLDSPALVVRAYDRWQGLNVERKTRAFAGVTDADLARRIAWEAGLAPGMIDDTAVVHDHVFQYDQTDAEFLAGRARRLGFEAWVGGQALHFRRPAPDGPPHRLAWGDTLIEFRPRLSTAGQVSEVEVRGWDARRRAPIVGVASRGPGGPGSDGRAPQGPPADGLPRLVVVDEPVGSGVEAEALARAVMDRIAASMLEADGTCDAALGLAPGRLVSVEGVGGRFGGAYYLTQVTHEWVADRPFLTRFAATGRRDRSLWSLLEDARPRARESGLAAGLVTNNRDPDGLGRVKLRFPWLADGDETDWARVAAPDRGGSSLPEVGDEVLVGFERGDIGRPIVLGVLGVDARPGPSGAGVAGPGGRIRPHSFRGPSGLTLTIQEDPGGESVEVADAAGRRFTLRPAPGGWRVSVEGDLAIEVAGTTSLNGRSL